MHVRGKAFTYEAIYPDGKREMLLDVPQYDFNWQTTYELAEPKDSAARHARARRGPLGQFGGQSVQS